MLVDTHCHVNLIIKKEFNVPLSESHLFDAQTIEHESAQAGVPYIINVGTTFVESQNCIRIAQACKHNYAVVGLHPSDCTADWKSELRDISELIRKKDNNKIVGIGECGLDFYHDGFNVQRQKDVFRAQIELALEHKLPLVIHTRNAGTETLECLEEYKNDGLTGVFHCFSEDLAFAKEATQEFGFFIGIGGAVTYPKNNTLREVVQDVTLAAILLETDAPFLPPQSIRGQKNHPREVATIAHYIADLMHTNFDIVAQRTTNNAKILFGIPREDGLEKTMSAQWA